MPERDNSINLAFRHTVSARCAVAVNLAKGFAGYRCEDDGTGTTHSVQIAEELRRHDGFTRFISLLKIVMAWRDSTLVIDGEVVPTPVIERFISVGDCYQRQRRLGNRYHYCNGFDPRHAPTHFGCRLLSEVTRYLPHNGDAIQSEKAWYRFGGMTGDLFSVDKRKILSVLDENARNSLAHHCPVYSGEHVAEEVASLPDTIEPGTNERWIAEVRSDGTACVRLRTLSDRNRKTNGRGTPNPLEQRDGAGKKNGHGQSAQDAVIDAQTDPRAIPAVRFADVGGQDKAVAEVRDWVELPLLYPDLFEHIGVSTQVGVILYGPPGTGKTLLAQAVAGECQAHLETVNGPEILSKWVGQSEENLRTIFERARQLAPSVVLLDEIDAIAPARDRAHHGHEITLVSQLLSLMDGLYDRGRIVVIATTNRLESVDPALRRPGRFDYAIRMNLPDAKGREAIFSRHLGRMAVEDNVDTTWLAEATDGLSGADIAKICRRAGMIRAKEAIREGYAALESVKIGAADLQAVLGEFGRPEVQSIRARF